MSPTFPDNNYSKCQNKIKSPVSHMTSTSLPQKLLHAQLRQTEAQFAFLRHIPQQVNVEHASSGCTFAKCIWKDFCGGRSISLFCLSLWPPLRKSDHTILLFDAHGRTRRWDYVCARHLSLCWTTFMFSSSIFHHLKCLYRAHRACEPCPAAEKFPDAMASETGSGPAGGSVTPLVWFCTPQPATDKTRKVISVQTS